jgi:hypothetical protein
VGEELSKWANSFRVRRDSAMHVEQQLAVQEHLSRKTIQSFHKPRSSLEIDPDQQQLLIQKAQQ